jgi:hypothetical protein
MRRFLIALVFFVTTSLIALGTIRLERHWQEAHAPNPCDSPDVLCVSPNGPWPVSPPTTLSPQTTTDGSVNVLSVPPITTLTLPADLAPLVPGSCWKIDTAMVLRPATGCK